MTKPTKTQLIKIRDESYRKQPVNCCGTCKHFVSHNMVPYYSGPLSARIESRCAAIELRGEKVRKDVSYLGRCNLYEPRKGGAK